MHFTCTRMLFTNKATVLTVMLLYCMNSIMKIMKQICHGISPVNILMLTLFIP